MIQVIYALLNNFGMIMLFMLAVAGLLWGVGIVAHALKMILSKIEGSTLS
ncbi:hypothetical protein [uncultured Pseudosulfitobacter sp.]|tara:strand:- start:1924 stop:2073 length:150 start_codon:yes stop_codon:yes gene_type:complete